MIAVLAAGAFWLSCAPGQTCEPPKHIDADAWIIDRQTVAHYDCGSGNLISWQGPSNSSASTAFWSISAPGAHVLITESGLKAQCPAPGSRNTGAVLDIHITEGK